MMSRGRLVLTALALTAAALTPAGGLAQLRLLTVAESSGFTATSRHADVMTFVRELQRQQPAGAVETLCTSTEGRMVPMLVVGNPPPASPADLRRDDRAVLYLQANIHAGEVEGKDAVLMLVRDLVHGKTPNVLDRLVLLVVPIFNADGNERISPQNRTSQKGPAQGVGARYNGQNLDLNRDGMKIESPEVAGLVDVLNRWDPVFFLDSHTHNGSYHQEPVTWTWGLNPNGDAAILDYMSDTMWPAIERTDARDSTRRRSFRTATSSTRGRRRRAGCRSSRSRGTSRTTSGLRNRLSVLNEQYPYVDFETRVRGCYHLLLSFLEFAHANTRRDGAPGARGRSPHRSRAGCAPAAHPTASSSSGTRSR